MIGLLQRVSNAQVMIDNHQVSQINTGLLVLIGIQRGDTAPQADRLLERLLNYRIFTDANGKMNHSLTDTGGGLLLVPQFTLAADTRKGTRPGFSTAAAPKAAATLFEYLATQAQTMHNGNVATGVFGADMQVSLTNDGPVTFWLEVPPEN